MGNKQSQGGQNPNISQTQQQQQKSQPKPKATPVSKKQATNDQIQFNYYKDKQNFEEGQIFFEKRAQEAPKNHAVHVYLGVMYRQQDLVDQAIQTYEKSIQIQPKGYVALNNLAQIYQSRGETQKALELYKKSVQIKPDFKTSVTNLGVLYVKLQNWNEALPMFEKAFKLDPKNTTVLDHLGLCYSKKNMGEKAIEIYKKSIEINNEGHIPYNNIAVRLLKDEKFHQAIDQFKISLELNPQFETGILNLGETIFKMNLKVSQTIGEPFETVFKLSNEYDYFENLAWGYYVMVKQRNFIRAEQFYDKALQLKEDLYVTHILKATNTFQMEKIEEGEQYFRQIAIRFYEKPYVFNKWADALKQKGMVEKSQKVIQYGKIMVQLPFQHKNTQKRVCYQVKRFRQLEKVKAMFRKEISFEVLGFLHQTQRQQKKATLIH